MTEYRYLIVGGGIAGTTAAETLRKGDPDATIAIVSDEPYPFYSRVLLSKPAFLLGKQPFDSVWMKKPEWYGENRIAFLGGETATALDPNAKVVTLGGGETIHYDKLLLAGGVHPRKWDVPGAEKKGVHYLRTLDHAKAIIDDLKAGEKKRAVMIGSACVTFEVAEILRSIGVEVTEIMREHWFWQPGLSERESMIVEKHLVDHGVKIIRDMEVAEVLGDGKVEGVQLRDGAIIPCDMVFAFIGVMMPTKWLEPSGIALDRGIVADEYLATSLPDVWTAGDTARYNDVLLHDRVMMGNWMNARTQGEIAAENMLGKKQRFELVSFHTSHGFGNMIGFAGDGRVADDRTYLYRGDEAAGAFGRIIVRGNAIVGATMVNRIPELGTLVKLIEKSVDISTKHAELQDPNFDLKTLLPSA